MLSEVVVVSGGSVCTLLATMIGIDQSEERTINFVSSDWLLKKLVKDRSQLIILDCRNCSDFEEAHVRDAMNFSVPTLMLKRLATSGKFNLLSTIRCPDLRDRIAKGYKDYTFVVYGQDGATANTANVLTRRLIKDGYEAVCLRDGFPEFHRTYPEWCESSKIPDCSQSSDSGSGDIPLMGLRSLRISSLSARFRSSTTSTEESSSDSENTDTGGTQDGSVGSFEDDKDFPIEIITDLYLGNAANSEDLDALSKHGIQYILNVTPDLPNKFEKCGNMKYMQIPITDHWSQNLYSFFPKAIQFIDEGRSQKKGVLVHCLAGVSRSVTITIAYLMSREGLNLNDAFTLVRSRKSNVGPNFHFMEQLHRFERELSNSPDEESEGIVVAPKLCSACGTPKLSEPCTKCVIANDSPMSIFGQSPDSGIEFDRWTPNVGE